EFGLTQQEFNQRLESATATARALGPLRVPGGTIKRDVFVTVFGQAAMEFRLVTEARPTVALSTRGGAVASTARPSTSLGSTLPGTAPRTSDAAKAGEVVRF